MAETLGLVAIIGLAAWFLVPLATATIQRPSEMLPKIGVEVLKLIGLVAILFAVDLMDVRGWLP